MKRKNLSLGGAVLLSAIGGIQVANGSGINPELVSSVEMEKHRKELNESCDFKDIDFEMFGIKDKVGGNFKDTAKEYGKQFERNEILTETDTNEGSESLGDHNLDLDDIVQNESHESDNYGTIFCDCLGKEDIVKRRYDEEYHKANHFKDEYPSDVEQGVGELNAGNVGKLDDDDVVNYKGDEEVQNKVETHAYSRNELNTDFTGNEEARENKDNVLTSSKHTEKIESKSNTIKIEQIERRPWYKTVGHKIKNAVSSVLTFVKTQLRRFIPWF